MNQDELPIDIYYNKLLDWLINRRHCQQQWQRTALTIRENINTALQDMPAVDEITQLLQGTYINYFHCQRIAELLKETGDGSKNIFGRYSSQRMKDWMDILKAYEKDGVYLAEAAQMLMRNVNYEIPALKKQITKCQQAQTDCTRKEGDYASSSNELKNKYHTSCKQLGIKGNKIKSELFELIRDMPLTYSRIEGCVKELEAARSYYSAFRTFLLNKCSKPSTDCLVLIGYLVEKGNTTTYEWQHGGPPTRVEQPEIDYWAQGENEEEEQQDEAIDWGDLGGSDAIDFDITVEGDTNSGIEAAEGAVANDGINWEDDGTAGAIDIELVNGSAEDVPSCEEGVARGSEALTLLDNPETRQAIINELLELQAFLSQRSREMEDDGFILAGIQFQAAPPGIQLDKYVIDALHKKVTEVVEQTTNTRIKELFLIRSSPRYVDRMANSLKKIIQDSEKVMSLSRLMVIRRQEALDEEKETRPKLDLIKKRTKELQNQIEKEISKKYKSRRVNIMGEINTM